MCFSLNINSHNINGIILLDKQEGLSSNYLLHKVKRLFRVQKAGHTGALDPLASGMLPICLGEATKFSKYLLDADKRYIVSAKLGEKTNTYDATGIIINTRPVTINQAMIEHIMEQFYGDIYQIPPMFSSIKYQGRALYKYARKGINIPRSARLVHIYNLQILDWDNTHIELQIHCSKGTYIRTIIDDIGELLGCGAHVTMLRRLAVAHYHTARMITLESLQTAITLALRQTPNNLVQLNKLLLPIDSAVANFPAIKLSKDSVARVRKGQMVAVDQCWQSGLVRMCENKGETTYFFGIGEITQPGVLKPKRLLAEKYV